jgi:hypothetical protein
MARLGSGCGDTGCTGGDGSAGSKLGVSTGVDGFVRDVAGKWDAGGSEQGLLTNIDGVAGDVAGVQDAGGAETLRFRVFWGSLGGRLPNRGAACCRSTPSCFLGAWPCTKTGISVAKRGKGGVLRLSTGVGCRVWAVVSRDVAMWSGGSGGKTGGWGGGVGDVSETGECAAVQP